MIKLSIILPLLICATLALSQDVASSSLFKLDAPVGTLEYASIHEAGHVVCAIIMGMIVTRALVFQRSKPGVGAYWKGTTSMRGANMHRGMVVAKLSGNFAELFMADRTHTIVIPSFLDIVGNRNVISESDVVTPADLGSDSLLTAQHKTYRALAGNVAFLRRVYQQLRTTHVYP